MELEKIKANELRIGNIVNFFAIREEYGACDALNIYAFSKSEDFMNNVIRPVLLTEEWLLNFGFERRLNKDWLTKQGLMGVGLLVYDGKIGVTHHFETEQNYIGQLEIFCKTYILP